MNIDLKLEPEAMSPLALAYVGDAVYELYVRSLLVAEGLGKMNELHRQAVSFVKATTQASLLKNLQPELSQEEERIVKRGRNAKSGHAPKKTEVIEYRQSTGLEALIGYLYLKGREERLEEILQTLCRLAETSQQKG